MFYGYGSRLVPETKRDGLPFPNSILELSLPFPSRHLVWGIAKFLFSRKEKEVWTQGAVIRLPDYPPLRFLHFPVILTEISVLDVISCHPLHILT